MDEAADKVRENLLRRRAERRGLRMEKSRRRDRGSLEFGTYQLVRPSDRYYLPESERPEPTVVASTTSEGYGMSLDDIEAWLDARDERQRASDEPFSTYVAVSPDVVAEWQPTGITRSVMVDSRVRVDYGPDGEIVGVLLVDVDQPTVRQYRRNWPGFDLPTERGPVA
jgi:hypothetical protein